MKEQTKMLHALEQIAQMVFPDIEIKEKTMTIRTEDGNVKNEFYVKGIRTDGYTTPVPVAVISRGYIHHTLGQQIEIVEGDETRYFPFFGFNWTYLAQ